MRELHIHRTMTSVALVVVLTGLLFVGLTFRPSYTQPVLAKDDNCTEHSARGTYGFALLGTLPIGLVAAGGATTFDGEGNQSGKFTITSSVSVQEFTFTGRYTVNRDCTGTARLFVTPSLFGASVVNLNAVGTNNLTELKWLVTDPGIFLAGTLTKQ